VKRTIAESRNLAAGNLELFKGGREEPLPNGERLVVLGLGEEATLFLLQRQGLSVLLLPRAFS
jgi:hypothetical protein